MKRLLPALSRALAAEPDPHTTVSDPEAALEVHVADSLSGLEIPELASARRIADIGSGAGFPGLVLALALPRAEVDLIESSGRKTAVMDRLIQAAELGNARSVTARAEDFARVPPPLGGGCEAYDAVTARAVGPLALLVEYAAPLLRPGRGARGVEGGAGFCRGGCGRRCRGEGGNGGEGGGPRAAVSGLREPASARVPQDRAHAAARSRGGRVWRGSGRWPGRPARHRAPREARIARISHALPRATNTLPNPGQPPKTASFTAVVRVGSTRA